MVRLKLSTLSVLIFLQQISAKLDTTTLSDGNGDAETSVCFTVGRSFTYDYTYSNDTYGYYYDSVCGYPPAVGTVLLCTYKMFDYNIEMQEKAFTRLASTCQYSTINNHTPSYYKEQFENATQHVISLSLVNKSLPLYSSTYANLTADNLKSYHTSQQRYFNTDAGTWFSVAFYGYFLILIMISALYNSFRLLGISKRINQSRYSKVCQKFIIFPALLPKGKYSTAYAYKFLAILMPNRIQFLVDLIFLAMEIAFYCVSYRCTPDTAYLWVAWVAHRSAVMSFGKIPLLVIFAGRNNFLLWITGWSYSTCLHFHKITAIWMFIDALIHSVAFTIDLLGYYVYYTHVPYFAWGIAATIFAGVMILQSLHFFRNIFYEYFLAMHVVFGVFFMVSCWYHCYEIGWMEWMVAACCVWFFDRLIRAIRMCAFGYRTATINVIGDQLFKIEVTKPSWWRHTSGTYGYIYFAGIIFWENHPFTIVCEEDKLCAYIRVKRGVTSRIWKKLVANNNTLTWKVCVEGPYGGKLSNMAKKYDEAFFVAGGSGAPGILEGATKATSGKFIWVSQNLELVTAYHKLIEQIDIPIDIYITRENANDRNCSKKDLLCESESDTQSTDGSEKNSSGKELGISLNQISIYYKRPNLEEIINREITEAQSSNVAIVACGPPVLMDNLRNVISENITSWEKSVDFFDEFQTW